VEKLKLNKSKKTYEKINRIPSKYIPVIAIASLSINLLSLALPLAMKKIYGSVIFNKSVDTLRYILIGVLIALTLEAVMRKVKESSCKWIGAKYEFQLQKFLMQKELNTFRDATQKSNYIANMETFKSISRLTEFHSTANYQLFIDVPFAFIFLSLIYYYGGQLVMIPILISVVYVLIVLVVSKLYFRHQSAYMENNDLLLVQLTEALEKIHFIKAAGIEESQINIYKKLLEDVSRTEYTSNRFQVIPRILGSNISQLTLFMLLIAGGYLVTVGDMTFGQITACSMLGGRAVAPIIGLMNYYQQTMEIKLLKKRIDAIANEKEQYKESVPSFPQNIQGAIELIKVGYKNIHTNSEESINRIITAKDFVSIDPKEFPSYRRIINKIIGRELVYSGKVLIDNLDITEWNMHSLKGKIEYLSEDVRIYKGSIMENLTFFDTSKIQKAYDAAALTGLDELVTKLPEGFSTEIDNSVNNYLTVSFLQRLNLSRALLERPRIIIFDRIDESMDDETLKMFIWLLEKLKGNSTIILASNNQNLLSLGESQLLPIQLSNNKKGAVV